MFGVDGEAGSQYEAFGFGDIAEEVEGWPRALGIDVIGSDGGDTAPVVDTGIE